MRKAIANIQIVFLQLLNLSLKKRQVNFIR